MKEEARGFYFVMTLAIQLLLPKGVLSAEQTEGVRALVAAARARGDVKGIA